MVGLLLLAGIVLSNAYKSENVRNMILPRKSLPYKFFEELVQGKVAIYTRSRDFHIQSFHSRIYDYGNITGTICTIVGTKTGAAHSM